ncbi:uncharacterized protein LOC130636091 isoform X1 [Hydractinia symbiolongicarpus]|uniref:uncharacterized protein LOC130636091 isoform X1 n=1 Tax=Hydractinia symbiolongicarpus TaxID=13093 RepID=UPI00254DBA9A|nr:uncharacterized protein LOC130636091 isoform X1 [Hydractinia symbiolongicarpus]
MAKKHMKNLSFKGKWYNTWREMMNVVMMQMKHLRKSHTTQLWRPYLLLGNAQERTYTRIKNGIYRRRDRTDVSFLMMKYYEVLDYGVLMDMKEESEISSTYKERFQEGMAFLENQKFPYFLYGTVAWERDRKCKLPDIYLSFLKNKSSEHDCCTCFNDSVSCFHECCIVKLKLFAAALKMKVKSSTHVPISHHEKIAPHNQAKPTQSSTPGNTKNIDKKLSQTTSFKTAKSSTLPTHLEHHKIDLLQKYNTNVNCKIAINKIFQIVENQMKLKPPYTNPFISNMNYLTSVIGKNSKCSTTMLRASINGENINIHCQEGESFNALCALNNVVSDLQGIEELPFSSDNFYHVVDELWLLKAGALETDFVNEIVPGNRSPSGGYDHQLVKKVAESKEYEWHDFDLSNWFKNNNNEKYTHLLSEIGVQVNARVLISLNKSQHAALMLLKESIAIINSCNKPPIKYLPFKDGLELLKVIQKTLILKWEVWK